VNSRTWEGTTERGTANFITGAATWSAETRFGYNLNLIDRIDQFWNVGLAHGIAETTPGGRRTPSISALGFSDGGGSELASYFGPVWTLEQKVSKSLGRHQLKFGGIFSRRKPGRLNIENSRIRYENKADLLANIPSRVQMTFGVNRYQGRSFEWGGFAQDDWRVTPRLTVNLGIRYDFFSKFVAVPDDPSAPAGLFNLNGLRDSQFNFGPFRDPNDPIESDGWANLGPRIGFSYNPDGNSKTVIRSGFGILFAPQPWDDFNNAVASSQAVPFRSVFSKAEAQREGFRFPAFNDDIRPVLERSGQVQTADVFDPNIQAPYSINYLFGIQRAITSGLVLESSYVGSRGVKFRLSRPFNQPDRVTGIRPNPNLGTGNYFDNSESTTYHSWQTSLRKRFSHGFTGDVHYTWGKTLSFSGGDTGAGFTGDKNNSIQDFFDVDVNRGPSTGDIVHNFVGDLIYEVPRFQQLGFVRHVLGGWQVSGILRARTGEPFTVTQPSSMSASRPDYVGGNAILDDYRSSLVYLNRAAFQRVPTSAASGAPLRAGSVGNNAFRGPGFISLDGSVGKNFSITERTRLQFRADMFNAANHTNYSNPNGNIESPTFGRITGTRGARTVQLNARFTF
jgi:outer membrane receptor protein involved in Fe transport